MVRFLSAALVSAAIAVPGAIGPAAAQDVYAGKTIRLLVGLQAGGTVDTLARAFAVHVRKHIPGNPTIVVQNMPGAAGANATNYLYEKAAPDGLTILFGPWDPLAQVMGDQGLRARYDQFEYLGGTGDIRVVYMRTDAVPGGLKKPADIARADNLILGALNYTDHSGLMPHLVLDVLGIKHKMIVGYRGGSDVFLAMERGEVQVHSTSISTFRSRNASFIESGQGMGITYLVPVDKDGHYERSPALPEMPAFPDLYKQIKGKPPSGRTWDALNWLTQEIGELTFVGFAPKGTPAAAVAALRKGFDAACHDPEFIKESIAKNRVAYSCIDVKRGQHVFRSLADVSPDVIASLRASISQH
jgi:tripartite-type tricarboxylate transporter receptor subunit TctC